MYAYIEPYSIKDISVDSNLKDTAKDISVKSRKFMLANAGAQPFYFKEKNGVASTPSNAMLVPANTVFPAILTADTLSVISNATGTTFEIMYLDM